MSGGQPPESMRFYRQNSKHNNNSNNNNNSSSNNKRHYEEDSVYFASFAQQQQIAHLLTIDGFPRTMALSPLWSDSVRQRLLESMGSSMASSAVEGTSREIKRAKRRIVLLPEYMTGVKKTKAEASAADGGAGGVPLMLIQQPGKGLNDGSGSGCGGGDDERLCRSGFG